MVGRGPARLVVDVGGVGYALAVPLGAAFPPEGRARVWTHLVVREDAHTLYGFPDRESRELFRLLLTVRGVGPAMALGVLSGLPRADLLDAIVAEDAAALTRVKGVGRKTADQILLDLRDKAARLREQLDGAELQPAGGGPRGNAHVDDAVADLVAIGYSEKEARKIVEKAAASLPEGDLETLVRAALRR